MSKFQLVDQRRKAFAVFGQINGVGRCAEDRDSRLLQWPGQVQRSLPAELHNYAFQRAFGLFDSKNFQHIFARQRLKIQPVAGVIIGRNSFRIAVDHDRFIARLCQCKTRMDAAIIELNPLPDAVGAAAKDNDFLAVRWRTFAFRLAKCRGLIGRIHIRRFRLKLRRAGIDAFEYRTHAEFVTQFADFSFGHAACHCALRLHQDTRTMANSRFHTGADVDRFKRQIGKALVAKAHGFQAAQAHRILRQSASFNAIFGLNNLNNTIQKPRIKL